MREIKFRAWDKDHKQMVFDLDGVALIKRFSGELTTIGSSYELMQYTGLKDKNGREIYEGDILSNGKWMNPSKEENKTIVEWNEKKCQWEGIYPDLWPWRQFEVIGNIYENSELINSTKEMKE